MRELLSEVQKQFLNINEEYFVFLSEVHNRRVIHIQPAELSGWMEITDFFDGKLQRFAMIAIDSICTIQTDYSYSDDDPFWYVTIGCNHKDSPSFGSFYSCNALLAFQHCLQCVIKVYQKERK